MTYLHNFDDLFQQTQTVSQRSYN